MEEKKLTVKFFKEIKPETTISGKPFKDYSYLCYISLYLLAAEYCQNKVILDAASGMGFGSFLLSQSADQMFGLDIDSSSLAYAHENYQNKNLSFLFADVTGAPFRDHLFDVIVSIETFEHLQPEQALPCLLEFKRILKPDGTFIISTPNRSVSQQITKNPDHYNEMEVEDFFKLLSSVFPEVDPYYQRKGVLQSMGRFYRIVRSDRLRLRNLVPQFIKNRVRKQMASQLEVDYPGLLEQLKVHRALNLNDIKDAVIQVAVCRKK